MWHQREGAGFCAEVFVIQGKRWQVVGQSSDGVIGSSNHYGYAVPGYREKFIDDYLRLRLYELTDENRAIVAQGIEKYGGGNLVWPNELMHFLDDLYRQDSI
jgi:hypothetical protein